MNRIYCALSRAFFHAKILVTSGHHLVKGPNITITHKNDSTLKLSLPFDDKEIKLSQYGLAPTGFRPYASCGAKRNDGYHLFPQSTVPEMKRELSCM